MERIKVIIVDDDRIILNGLTSMLDWGRFGFEVVATAINGKQGISRFQEYLPRVVFTDIKMPVMDGLAMLKAIREEDSNVRFIILSAFGEFAYAKQAIELGARFYILKEELNPTSLSAILDQTKSEIETQSISSFEAIIETVLSYVEIGVLTLDSATSKTNYYFNRYLDLHEAYSLESLTKRIDTIFRKAYEQSGKSAYYIQPASPTRDALKQWILGQLRIVDGWRLDANRDLTPVVSNAIFIIRENFTDVDFSIRDVSERVGMSDGRLSVLFKQEIGKTMKEYITSLRVDLAKRLLKQGNYRIYEIAEKVGFTSAEYFSRVFTKIAGSPPQYYWKDDAQ